MVCEFYFKSTVFKTGIGSESLPDILSHLLHKISKEDRENMKEQKKFNLCSKLRTF
jgi:hypothetical protein